MIDTPSSVIGRSSHWDAVVLGSGPAGALAAYLLARQSLRTLLIEKQAFPRYKVCGGCLNSRALRVLDEVGLGQLCDTVGANSVNCVRLYASGKSATIRMPLGRSVSRQLFDAALVEYGVAAGVEFRDETRAQVLPADGPCEYRRVELRTETGQTEIVAGKVIVVADGLGHPTLRQLSDFRVSVSPASYVGLGANTGCLTSNIEPNTITMAVGRHGYLGSVLVENDTINMAAAVNANAIKKMGAEKVIATIISDSGVSLDFTHDRKWVGTRPLTCRSSLVVGERLFLIGDATGYVEPFTGEGMAWALSSAQAVVPLVRQGCLKWNSDLVSTWSKRQELSIRQQRICRGVTQILRHPLLSKSVVSLLHLFPGFASPVVSGINHYTMRKSQAPN